MPRSSCTTPTAVLSAAWRAALSATRPLPLGGERRGGGAGAGPDTPSSTAAMRLAASSEAVPAPELSAAAVSTSRVGLRRHGVTAGVAAALSRDKPAIFAAVVRWEASGCAGAVEELAAAATSSAAVTAAKVAPAAVATAAVAAAARDEGSAPALACWRCRNCCSASTASAEALTSRQTLVAVAGRSSPPSAASAQSSPQGGSSSIGVGDGGEESAVTTGDCVCIVDAPYVAAAEAERAVDSARRSAVMAVSCSALPLSMSSCRRVCV